MVPKIYNNRVRHLLTELESGLTRAREKRKTGFAFSVCTVLYADEVSQWD